MKTVQSWIEFDNFDTKFYVKKTIYEVFCLNKPYHNSNDVITILVTAEKF